MTPKRHVGVVGAGVSGLRCADILLAHGVDVTVLEARDRIGGRICQSDALGYTVDLGPNWIHGWDSGEEEHPILRLARQTGTALHAWSSAQRVFDGAGRALPAGVADRLSTLLWDVIGEAIAYSAAERGGDHAGDHTNAIPADASLYDFVARHARARLAEEDEDEAAREAQAQLLLQMSEMWGAYVGAPVWRQSLRFAWMEACCGGDELFVASSYRDILARVAQPALAAATVRLGQRVVRVETADVEAADGPDGPGGPADGPADRLPVRVTTAAGDAFAFDAVVVSTPLGWLQQHHAATFAPPLPPRLAAAIGHLGCALLEKVYLTFPRAFWMGGPASTASTTPYTNWLAPAYAPDTNPQRWPQEAWNLAALAAPNRHPTLLFYTYGACARHVVEHVHGRPAAEQLRFLAAFFRPYYARLPGYDAAAPGCAPAAALATAWQRDALAGGASYCNFPAGIEAADQDVRALRAGCPARRLWFCGEHAAPFDECGTVAGAYRSGEAAAAAVLAAVRATEAAS